MAETKPSAGGGNPIMGFLNSVPGMSILSSIMGLFGGDDGVGSFSGMKASDPRTRFVDPTESMFTANRGLAELGTGFARRAEQPMRLQTQGPGKMTTTGFGMDPVDLELPGLNMGLSGFLESLLNPTQTPVQLTGSKRDIPALKAAGQPDFQTGQRSQAVPLARKQNKGVKGGY